MKPTPTAQDVLKAHELLEGAERDKMFGYVDVAYRVASYIAEERADQAVVVALAAKVQALSLRRDELQQELVEARAAMPDVGRVAVFLREYAAQSDVSKYDAHVLEEAAKTLEGVK